MSDQLKKNGRWLFAAILLLYFGSIYAGSFYMPYDVFWRRYLLVTTSRPAFLDTHNFTSGIDCSRLGYDVLRVNPCEPNKVPMTYPRIWLSLKWLGVSQSESNIIGLTLMAGFFASLLWFIGRISIPQALFYAVIVCSPSVMMAVETGNNDLVVFLIMMLALAVLRDGASSFDVIGASLLFFAAILKYFPIASFVYVWRYRKATALIVAVPAFVCFGVYLWWTRSDFIVIEQLVQRSTFLSFGGVIVFQVFRAWTAPWLVLSQGFISAAYTIVAGAVALAALVNARRSWPWSTEEGFTLDAFRMGAAIYVVSFLLWSNWDYRFIFLLFTLPLMLAWLNPDFRQYRFTRAAMIALMATLWLSSGAPANDDYRSIRPVFIDELLNWYLFFFYTAALVGTAPRWVHELIEFATRPVASRREEVLTQL